MMSEKNCTNCKHKTSVYLHNLDVLKNVDRMLYLKDASVLVKCGLGNLRTMKEFYLMNDGEQEFDCYEPHDSTKRLDKAIALCDKMIEILENK